MPKEMDSYLVKNGQTVYDVVNDIYKDLSFIYIFLSDNPLVTSIDFDLNSIPNLSVTFNPANIITIPVSVTSTNPESEITSKEFIGRDGMTIYDVCLQVYGSLDLLYQLINDSNFNNIEQVPQSGNIFTFNPQKTTDNLFAFYLKSTDKIINTFTRPELPEDNYRIIETGEFRIIETGEFRVIE